MKEVVCGLASLHTNEHMQKPVLCAKKNPPNPIQLLIANGSVQGHASATRCKGGGRVLYTSKTSALRNAVKNR